MFGGGVQVFGESAPAFGGSEAKKPKQEEKMTVLPVTVRAVEKAMGKSSDEADIQFYGTQPGMLLLVGLVESISTQGAAIIEFCLNDSTGRIRARFFSEGADVSGIAVGSYVVVAGQLRTLPSTHISVTTMRPVRSADEVSYHVIECAHAMLKLQRGIAEPATLASRMASTPVPKKAVAETLTPPKDVTAATVVPTALSFAPLSTPAPVAPAATKGPQALQGDDLKKAILAFLQKEGESKEQGLSLATVCCKFLPATDVAVRAAMEQLVLDGDAFNTIDDDHFNAI